MTKPVGAIPAGLTAHKRTPEFTEATIPAGLLKAHATKEGVWGLIQVVEGELIYRVVDTRRSPAEFVLSPSTPGVVEPEILHEVEPRGPVRFYVEFLR